MNHEVDSKDTVMHNCILQTTKVTTTLVVSGASGAGFVAGQQCLYLCIHIIAF